jgi:hypothetical protein
VSVDAAKQASALARRTFNVPVLQTSPAGSPFVRSILRALVTGLLVGAVGLGSAWGAASFVSPGDPTPPAVPAVSTALPGLDADLPPVGPAAAFVAGKRLPKGWFRVGSKTTTLVPPAKRLKSKAECEESGQQTTLYTPLTPEGCLITFDGLWVDGVDRANPISARAIAVSNGQSTVVFTLMDVVGYMAAYPASLCATCGIDPITKSLSAELKIPAANMIISSSHTHAAPSTIANGGAWYYEFVRDQVKAAIRGAVAGLRSSPLVRLETGATSAKAFNVDRRIQNRAIPDYELAWMRAFVPTSKGKRTIATFGNFAVHPTIRNANARLHSGMVGPFTRRVTQRLGGASLFLPGALGDQTPDKGFGINGIGIGLADALIADVRRGGYVLRTNDIAVARTSVQVPIENQFFVGALAAGYAVRDFLPPYGGGPHAVATENEGTNLRSCEGAGALHVVTPISAIRFGAKPPPGKRKIGVEYQLPVATDNVVVVQSPGEIFASIGLIVKDYLSRSNNVLVQGVTNDTIGYIIPANQYDLFASQGLGLANNAAEVGNYEEALSLGKCTGELVTNAMLDMGKQLGVMGEGEGR